MGVERLAIFFLLVIIGVYAEDENVKISVKVIDPEHKIGKDVKKVNTGSKSHLYRKGSPNFKAL